MPLLQRNVVIERSGMPQASKRVAGRSEHGAAVRRPPDPFPPITPHPEGVPHLNLRLQARRLRYDERRWRLRRLEGVTVGLRSSSSWLGELICESGAQSGLDPRAKNISPLQRSKSPRLTGDYSTAPQSPALLGTEPDLKRTAGMQIVESRIK
jgi:hypothetical protein